MAGASDRISRGRHYCLDAGGVRRERLSSLCRASKGMPSMSSHEDRLKELRAQLAAQALDGFVVPLTDERMSEYVGSYASRLTWLTGFESPARSAVRLPAEAAIFVDGLPTL